MVADYSKAIGPVTINLSASTATVFSSTASGISREAPMLKPLLGWSATPLFTVGETIGTGASEFTPIGALDGTADFKLNASTVRILVNHEVDSSGGKPYTVSSDTGTVSLTGARIDYFDIDIATKFIVGAGSAITKIHNRQGAVVDSASDLEHGGLSKFCSSVLVKANTFGTGKGVAQDIYFTGEENGKSPGGSLWALEIATGEFWAMPDFGRGKWENITAIDTGDTSRVAFLLGDDTPGAALYMYVGTKSPTGDFLAKNGLRDGQLYVWKADSGDLTASTFTSGQRTGTWVPLSVKDVASAGTTGFDTQGYKTATKLAADADALGAFSFARVEDQDRDPASGTNFVFTVTGNAEFDSGSNTVGVIHNVSINLAALTATVSVLYNGNIAPDQLIRSPDNLDWSADGWIYVQEDRAADIFASPSPNTNESSILRINPATNAIERIAIMNRGAAEPYFSDSSIGIHANWESTGIIDVSTSFGQPVGTLFITNIMAHGVGAGDLVEGGQMLLLAKPGDDHVPGVTVKQIKPKVDAIGSVYADNIIGNDAANSLWGRAGHDTIYGGKDRDMIHGGKGEDVLTGGKGADRYVYTKPVQAGDTITNFSATDLFQFEGSAFGLGTYRGTLAAKHLRVRNDKKAQDSDDLFIFRKTDDTLWFDKDGNGSAAPIKIADAMNDVLHFTASDIIIL
jgi:hypothetical protein